MELIETFSNLFDCLSKSLEKGTGINYSSGPTRLESAVGHFLTKIPNYKKTLQKQLKNSYVQSRQSLKPFPKPQPFFQDFDLSSKKLLKLGEINSIYFARYQRTFIRRVLEKTRKWAFKAVFSIVKEQKLCILNMNNSNSNYKQKLEELSDDYTWKRFFFYLGSVSAGYAKLSEKKLLKEIKEKIEQHLKKSVNISRTLCLENLYFKEPSTERKGQKKLANYSKK